MTAERSIARLILFMQMLIMCGIVFLICHYEMVMPVLWFALGIIMGGYLRAEASEKK